MAAGEDGLTYVGHATVLAELSGARLLTDPLLGAGILHVRRRVPVPVVEDLGPLTAILISHAHRDHLDHRSLRRLPADCPLIVPAGCGTIARGRRAREVIELAEGDRVTVGDIIVEAVHADHDGRRNPFGQQVAALGYLLEGHVCVYFAGDTDLFAGMTDLAGRVDVALLPVGGWGPRVPAGHLDPDAGGRGGRSDPPADRGADPLGNAQGLGCPARTRPLAPARSFVEAVGRSRRRPRSAF